ncbi:MAG: mandelate racemase/muconate lactonizing enzyme family protein [Anaerolineae bacterium]
MNLSHQPFTISNASVRHEQTPITHPVKTAFGTMTARHAVFLIVENEAGQAGVGESWINFPVWGHLNRIHDFEEAIVPFLIGREVAHVPNTIRELYDLLKGPALQSGTVGPLLQAICAVELALWDLAGRVEGKPLSHLLYKQPHSHIQVYASGINSPLPYDLINQHLDKGVKLFKLKLGFSDREDRANLIALKKHLGDKADLAVDVNRGWSFKTAKKWLPILAHHNIKWLEEPLNVEDEHQLPKLRERTSVPLSGGENVLMPPHSDSVQLAQSPFDILQPDLTKYTPLHVALGLKERAEEIGKSVIPHILGSGPGQAASLQFAAGCKARWVELDINENRLRTELCQEPFEISDGQIVIPDRPGIGWSLES